MDLLESQQLSTVNQLNEEKEHNNEMEEEEDEQNQLQDFGLIQDFLQNLEKEKDLEQQKQEMRVQQLYIKERQQMKQQLTLIQQNNIQQDLYEKFLIKINRQPEKHNNNEEIRYYINKIHKQPTDYRHKRSSSLNNNFSYKNRIKHSNQSNKGMMKAFNLNKNLRRMSMKQSQSALGGNQKGSTPLQQQLIQTTSSNKQQHVKIVKSNLLFGITNVRNTSCDCSQCGDANKKLYLAPKLIQPIRQQKKRGQSFLKRVSIVIKEIPSQKEEQEKRASLNHIADIDEQKENSQTSDGSFVCPNAKKKSKTHFQNQLLKKFSGKSKKKLWTRMKHETEKNKAEKKQLSLIQIINQKHQQSEVESVKHMNLFEFLKKWVQQEKDQNEICKLLARKASHIDKQIEKQGTYLQLRSKFQKSPITQYANQTLQKYKSDQQQQQSSQINNYNFKQNNQNNNDIQISQKDNKFSEINMKIPIKTDEKNNYLVLESFNKNKNAFFNHKRHASSDSKILQVYSTVNSSSSNKYVFSSKSSRQIKYGPGIYQTTCQNQDVSQNNNQQFLADIKRSSTSQTSRQKILTCREQYQLTKTEERSRNIVLNTQTRSSNTNQLTTTKMFDSFNEKYYKNISQKSLNNKFLKQNQFKELIKN